MPVRCAWLAWLLPLLMGAGPGQALAQTAGRQQQLVRMVRQDCGACHGMRLNGGLGPALTPQALAERPLDSLVATILQGRPGTPMPPWQPLISEPEARWIAERLQAGFPEEPPKALR